MKFFNECPITREEVINIVNSYVTNITNNTNTLIPCASTVCDDVAALEAVNHRIFISDGITTEEIAVGETMTLAANVATKVKPIVSATNTFAFAIDTSGATDGQVFTYDAGTGTIVWQSVTALTSALGNTLIVSKLGVDATGVRESINNHYLTVSAAIAEAIDGDTIIVYPGIYVEGVINLNALTGEPNGYDKLTIEMVGDVVIDGSLVGSYFGLNLIGPGAIISNSIGESAINLIGTPAREVFIDLLRVESNSIMYTLSLYDFVNVDVSVQYINNVSPASPSISGVVNFHSNDTVKFKGTSVYSNSSENPMINLSATSLLDFNLLKAVNVSGKQTISIVDCTGDVTINRLNCGKEGFQITSSTLIIKNTNIKGTTNESALVQIEGVSGNNSKVIFLDCLIEGFTFTDADPTSPYDVNIVNIGNEGLSTTDFCKVKFDGSTIINKNPAVNSGCVGLSGSCASSNIKLWFQNCHLYSGSASIMAMHLCSEGVYMGTNADVYYYGSNTSNGSVSVEGLTNFIGTLTTNAAFVANIDIL